MLPSYSAVAPDGAKRLHHSFDSSVDMEKHSVGFEARIDEVLPIAMLTEILSRLPDARDLASCASVSKAFHSSFVQVRAVRLRCRLRTKGPGEAAVPFKDAVTGTLKQLKCVADLRLEIEDEMQVSRLKDDGIERNRLWLSEKGFVLEWLPSVWNSLQNLTIIDYGQQAIFKTTPLLQLLAAHCKQLQTLELRNMFLDCKQVEKMNKVKTMTLRCVKLADTGLRDINYCMPQLAKLTLVTVVGLKEAVFESDNLKELCLGLATKVKLVRLNVRRLEKLQLKMACPEKLIVRAPDLECLALSLDKREKKTIEFDIRNLRELLMGATEFNTLTSLSFSNASLQKVFLDVPCMGFEDSGAWKGVKDNEPLAVPDMDAMRTCCPNLKTMSVGPGLWHALEVDSSNKDPTVPKWPLLSRLIVHMIVQDMAKTMGLLTALLSTTPTLSLLEVYVHTDSLVQAREFYHLKAQFPQVVHKYDSWKKGLKFDCFSF